MTLPLFNGFRTRNKVHEARARLEKLDHQKILLQDGLALQIQYVFLQMQGAAKQESATGQALEAASENRSLTARAYQAGMKEVQDLVEAQLMEAFMNAQYQKIRYDHARARAQLDLVVGTEVHQVIRETQK